MPEYALVLLVVLIFSVILHRVYKIRLFKSKLHMLISYAIFLFVGLVWGYFAISRGHWSFGDRFLLGPKIGLMPIEELAFVVIVSYFVFVISNVVKKELGRRKL